MSLDTYEQQLRELQLALAQQSTIAVILLTFEVAIVAFVFWPLIMRGVKHLKTTIGKEIKK